jgi:hypothetical protein
LVGFEVKAGKKVGKGPKSWLENCKNSTFIFVNYDNDWDNLLTE